MIDNEKLNQLNSLFAAKGVKLAYRIDFNWNHITPPPSKFDVAILFDTNKSTEEMLALKIDLTARMIHLFDQTEIDVAILDHAPLSVQYQTVRQGELLFDPENRHPDYYIKTFSPNLP